MPTSMTDEVMRALIATARNYTFVILHPTPRRQEPGADRVVWEHARRNFELRAEKRLSIVCPVRDGSDVCGMYLFPGTPEETAVIMEEDPGVKAGIFTYDVHPCRGFPGDALP